MIHRQDREQVTVLRFEHGKVNAIDVEFFTELDQRLDEALDSGSRALVLTGTGNNFSAGVNLIRVLEEGGPYLESFLPILSRGLHKLFTLPLPVVAAINGHAIAGGMILACACDHRVLAEGKVKLGVTELMVGVPFPVMPLEVLRHLVPTHAGNLILSGRLIGPAEAHELGVVDEVVAGEAVVERACEVASQLARLPGEAFAATKRLLRLPALERVERYGPQIDPEVQRIWSAPETLATIRAFLDKTVAKKS